MTLFFQKEIKKTFVLYNKNGILTNKYIKYDSKLRKIKAIPMLKYNNNLNIL